MLSLQNHLCCWALSLLAATVYAIVPGRDLIFPAVYFWSLFQPLDKNELAHFERGGWLMSRLTSKGVNRIGRACGIVSMGLVVRTLFPVEWSNGIPVPNKNDWRLYFLLHTLAAFVLVSKEMGYNARHLPCLPDARIPPGCGLAYICRYVYATSIHWAILFLLSYSTSVMPIWRQFLQYSAEYYNYHPGPDCWKSDCWMDCMFSMPLLVPLFMQLQLIAVLLLFTCPFLDTAETITFAIHRRVFPSLVPSPEACVALPFMDWMDKAADFKFSREDYFHYAAFFIAWMARDLGVYIIDLITTSGV